MKGYVKIILVIALLAIVTPVLAITTLSRDEEYETQAYTIVDKTKDSNIVCAQVLEKFYEDDTYEYYFGSAKGDLVIVEYSNGEKESVSDALNRGKITIDELDDYGIKYYSEEK